jgi:hypothetical protein
MERADWLDGGFDSAGSRFLMVTAITHRRFNSAVWGEQEIRKLYAEPAEIEASAAGSSRLSRRGPRDRSQASTANSESISGQTFAEVMPGGCGGPRSGRELSG